jgi:hypothetical protein
VLGIAAAAGTMLMAAAIPASATPAQANYSGLGYGGPSIVLAENNAYANALSKAEAAGFTSSQCQPLGKPQLGTYNLSGPLIDWMAAWQAQCATQPVPGTVNLNRYNGPEHLSSTGSAPSGYYLEGSLGWLYSNPTPGTVPLYQCKVLNSIDTFTSPDSGCEGQNVVGPLGYIYTAPPAGLASRVVRRCTVNGEHFDSNDINCEGQVAENILGYSLD